MDPLSITASIIAVLELNGTLMNYANSVRHAPKERTRFAREASNMYALLTNLRFRMEDAHSGDPWFDQVKLLGAPSGVFDQFKLILERLVAKIHSNSTLSNLIWKFEKREIEEALMLLERLKTFVSLALTNDHLYVKRPQSPPPSALLTLAILK